MCGEDIERVVDVGGEAKEEVACADVEQRGEGRGESQHGRRVVAVRAGADQDQACRNQRMKRLHLRGLLLVTFAKILAL